MVDTEVRDIIAQAYETIADEGRWTTFAQARDANGLFCGANSPSARQWCAVGVLAKAADISIYYAWPDMNDPVTRAFRYLNGLASELFPASTYAPWPLVWVNNTLDHEAVCQVFEKALVRLEEQVA